MMSRFLIHVALAATVVLVPSVRILCSGSCAPEDARGALSDAVPDCHERETDASGPEPLADDCRHAGEASWSSLSASAKAVGMSATAATVASTPVVVSLAGSPHSAGHTAPIAVTTGQSLGLFLTPLRI